MTPNKENYLKAVYELGGVEHHVSNKQITEVLNITGASATEMNNRLEKDGLLNYTPYRGVVLTEQGHQEAVNLVRKHRIWEVFLYDILKYNWDEVNEEADHLEHASSDRLIERLYDYLGRPKYDPHGALIPSWHDRKIIDESTVVLSSVELGSQVKVREVVDSQEVLSYVQNIDMTLGKIYTVVRQEALDGSIVLKDEQGQQVLLSPILTQSIFVQVI